MMSPPVIGVRRLERQRSTINAMAGGTRGTRPTARMPGETLDLLPLALARPSLALARAREVLADDPAPFDASVAHQVAGIVLRDFGDVGAAVQELRAAVRLARVAHS